MRLSLQGENYKPNDGVNLVSLLQRKNRGYKNYDQLKQRLKITNDDWVKEQARQIRPIRGRPPPIR